eukprot:SAG11_NODE_3397_length_2471_cov_2.713744_5_plen_61_part_01
MKEYGVSRYPGIDTHFINNRFDGRTYRRYLQMPSLQYCSMFVYLSIRNFFVTHGKAHAVAI